MPKYLKDYWTAEYDDYNKTFIQEKNEQYLAEKKNFRRRLDNFNTMLLIMEKSNIKFLVGCCTTVIFQRF